jgi:hypothetical protein
MLQINPQTAKNQRADLRSLKILVAEAKKLTCAVRQISDRFTQK